MMKKAFVLIILIGLVVFFLFPVQQKGVKSTLEPFYPGCKIGKQYLVLIAIDKYQHWRPLQNPVNDAKAIKEVLTSCYHIDRVIELYDKKATKKTIMKLLRNLQDSIQPDDSLLIFYSGHGHLDDASDNSFWIPVDGGKDSDVKDRWISNSEIRGNISNMSSKHILIIADSCFSGDLLQLDKGISPEFNNEYYEKVYSLRCRQALTSGARERVPDDSVFVSGLKLAFKENTEPYIDTLKLYDRIRLGMKETLPLLGEIKGTNHQQGASFLFFLKSSSVQPVGDGGVNIEDLEELAKWQNKVQKDIDKIEKFDERPEVSPELKIIAWKRLLKTYWDSKTYIINNEKLEGLVKKKIEYWNKIDSRNKKEADDKAVESAKKVNSIESYEKYLLEFPEGQHVAEAYYYCGVVYYEQNDYDKAVSNFTKAIEKNPEFVNAYIYRGLSYDELKQYKQAIVDYTQAINLDPQNSTAFNNRGISYDNSGKYEEAIKSYTSAINLGENDALYYNNRGISYKNLGKYKKAISNYKKAIKIRPDYIGAYNNMAYAYEKLGKTKEAKEARLMAEKLKKKKENEKSEK